MNKKIITLVLTFITAINLLSGVITEPEKAQQVINSFKEASVFFSADEKTEDVKTNGDIYSYGSAIDFFGSLRVE